MQKFRYLPHTADMAFVSYGSTFRMALGNSALALLNIMLDLKAISKDRGTEAGIKIKESAPNKEELVWFTLQSILSKIDAKKINAYRFDVSRISERNGRHFLEGRLLYRKTKSDYSLLSVKAVTPHGLKIDKRQGIYSINVVVDV